MNLYKYSLIDLTSSIKSSSYFNLSSRVTFKTKGVQFGIIASSESKSRLFIKAHQNYPYKGPCQYPNGNQSSSSSYDWIMDPLGLFLSADSVDLKELFAYKVLEYTGFWANSAFYPE